MLSIEEALDAVIAEARARTLAPVLVTLEQSHGCVLAEAVQADADSPPFDKALVDGYAVRAGDLLGDERSLSIGELITAGRQPSRALGRREAAVIMTGAPIPPGCDTVVMQERTRTQGETVIFEPGPIKSGQNLMPRGAEMRAGQVVLERGSVLYPERLGVLASVGRATVRVVPRPRVAIVSTGDELVEPGEIPGPGQIRNSNAVMLHALAVETGARACSLPIAPDEPAGLSKILDLALGNELVLVTGGVSAGQRDLVPDVLASLGVRRVFHKVRVRPGKPLWFGVGPPRAGGRGAVVFGLPGNPVSGLVGFLIFARPALAALSGRSDVSSGVVEARLACSFSHSGDRTTYFPARLVPAANEVTGGPWVETVRWSGSADLLTVASADGFAIFPAGDREYAPAATVGFLPLR